MHQNRKIIIIDIKITYIFVCEHYHEKLLTYEKSPCTMNVTNTNE